MLLKEVVEMLKEKFIVVEKSTDYDVWARVS